MDDIKAKLTVLKGILDKKAEILKQVYAVMEKQELFHKTLEGADKEIMLAAACEEKDKLVEEAEEADKVFLSIFDGFKGRLNENREIYKNELNVLKQKIKNVTDIFVKIQVKEERNKALAQKISCESPKIKGLKMSKGNLLKAYEKNKTMT